jgi:putative lipoprotein
VPIPFSLSIDRSALDPRHAYSVSARITIDDRLAWASDTDHPVSLDAPGDVEIVVVMVPAAPAD